MGWIASYIGAFAIFGVFGFWGLPLYLLGWLIVVIICDRFQNGKRD